MANEGWSGDEKRAQQNAGRRAVDLEARSMIAKLESGIDRLIGMVEDSSEAAKKASATAEKAAQVAAEAARMNTEHNIDCNRRDLKNAETTARIDLKLEKLDLHRDYMSKSLKRNEKFNWSLVVGVATVIGLIIADFVGKHLH